MPVHMWWLNDGIAPVYSEYDLMLELLSAQKSTRIRIPVDIRKWLPGDAVFDGSVYIPEELSEGSYDVRVAILDPRTGDPAIRLAIEGRQADGWYAMGALTVKNSEPLP